MADFMNIKSLLERLNISLQKYKAKVAESDLRGENFDVFEEMDFFTRHEEQLHTPFISMLLRTEICKHGLGEKFLESFIKDIIVPIVPEFHYDYENSHLEESKNIGKVIIRDDGQSTGGEIDIFLHDDNGSAIIIENKFDRNGNSAQDQDKQLERYYNYGHAHFHKVVLIYLTPDGHEASSKSLGKLKDSDYLRASYDADTDCPSLLDWVEHCVELAARRPLIRETIIQYITYVKNKRNIMDDSAKNEFFTIMAQYPEVVAEMFHNGFHAFRNFILENYSFPQFENECKTRNLIFNQENILESDKNKRGNNEVFFSFKRPEWEHFKIYVDSESHGESCYIGIASLPNDSIATKHPRIRLGCMSDEPQGLYPHGSSYLKKYDSLEATSILPALIDKSENGYCAYIMSWVDKILNEIDSKKIKIE
jgi:hypothetical protein